MKRSLFLILMTLFMSQGYSQSFDYGFGTGVNYTNMVLNNVPGSDSDFKVGMQFNVILRSQLNDRLWLRLEPGYAQRGAVLSSLGYSDTKINLNYFVLPVVFEFSPIDKFSILFGPEVSYRLAAKAKEGGDSSNIKSIYDSKIDLGVIASVSYCITDNLALELRYNRGFVSTIKDLTFTDEYGNSEGKARLFNQGIAFSFAYIL